MVFILIAIGFVFIYSASNYSAQQNMGDKFHFVKKQFFGFVLGIVALLFAYKFDYHKFLKFRWHIIIVSLLLLVLVFVPFISVSANGARRWIGFGSLTIQPSEIAKFGFVIFTSCYMSLNYNKMKTLKGILPVVAAGGLICLLVLLEPNLSVTLCIGMVMILMLLVGGISFKHFLLLLIPAVALVPILIVLEPYRIQRLMAFLNPWANPLEEGYQLIQSLYSLGAGGVLGLGLFNSRQKYLFLPFSESDFIFSIIGEEVGFIGATFVILLYLWLVLLGIRIAIKSKNRLGCYMAFGIIALIGVQALINIAVVTGTIPPTGIPLPFVSAGGTSLAVFMASIGILLNINKNSDNSVVSNSETLGIHKTGGLFEKFSFNMKRKKG